MRCVIQRTGMVGLACLTACQSGGVHWGSAIALSNGAASGAAPAVAVAGDSQVTAAWVGAPENGTDGELVVRPDLSQAAEYRLHDSAGALTIYGETPPKLAYGPDGTLYAAYLVTKAVAGHKWPVNTLRFAWSSDHGAHWSAPTTVRADTADGGSTDDHALFVSAYGTIYLTWLALAGDTSHTFIAQSRDRGVTWSKPAVIDRDPSCPCCRTTVTADAKGKLYVAWRKIFPSPGATEVRDIVVATSVDRGETWSAPHRVHEDNWHVNYCPDAGPSIKVGDDGVVHVAWWTGKPGAAGVQYTQSHDGGVTFLPPIAMGLANASRAAHVQLALGNGGQSSLVTVAWDDGTRAVPPIMVRMSRNGGRTFSSGDALTTPDQSGGYPVIGFARDSLHVVWQQRSLAGEGADSVRHDSAVAAIARSRGALPASAQWINPVGAWSVVARSAVVR